MARLLPEDITTVMDDTDQWSILLYGDYGAGKTVLGAQAPGIMLLDTERSRRSLLNHPDLIHTPVLKNATYERCTQLVREVMTDNTGMFDNVKTLQLDSVTELNQKLVDNELVKAHTKNAERSLYQPSRAEWTTANRMIRKLIAMVQDKTDKNLIIVAHEKEEKDEDSGIVYIRPSLGPSLLSTVASLVDAMFYLSSNTDSKGVTTRKLQTIPTKRIKGKNRIGSLPPEIINPTFSDILKAIEEQKRLAIEYSSNSIRS